MVRTVLSFVCYGIAFVAFTTWFLTARRLGQDTTGAGPLGDQRLRLRLRWLMAAGFVALIAAYLL